MTYLITGATGFVGKYLIRHILMINDEALIIAITRNGIVNPMDGKFILEQLDLNNREQLSEIIKKYRPNYVINLAAESSVSFSWKDPVRSFNNNVNIFLNLLEAIRLNDIDCRILSVGSSEGYGKVDRKFIPLKETSPLNPVSPYAAARVSQELLSKIYVDGYGMDIVLTRSFNHFGPGQDKRFVVPSFINKALQVKIGTAGHIETGDLTIVRDFVDVRDVVKAYVLLLEVGICGEIYNVCSGKGTSLSGLLDQILHILEIEAKPVVNAKFVRPNDNPIIIGDNSKIIKETSWTIEIDLESSLKDVIEFWKNKLNI